ncbi:MAG: type III pantothenate kinase [Lentisphaeria bacterium]|nr:type III pantothenate kinase [Lentisphaeria bacterium]
MKRLLLLNIGNTHTQCAFADLAGNIEEPLSTVPTAQWQENLQLLPQADAACPVWAACVVPSARKILTESRQYKNLHWVDAAAGETAGLDFSQIDASTLGADRIANAATLLKNGRLPASNFDCGTAITLETVLENGVFAGGAIMPGRKLMRSALKAGTAALPEIPLAQPMPEKLGTNTLGAMTLGIDLGAVGMVREIMSRSSVLGVKNMVASGGDAEFFCKYIPELEPAGKLFTLQGIHFIAVKHLEKE